MRYRGPETEILHGRYARALIDAATAGEKLDEVAKNLSLVSEMVRKNKQLSKILLHPGIDKAEKINLLESISKKARFCGEFRSFITVLARKNRLGLIHGVFLRYRDFYEQRKGLLKVFVTTAVSLSAAQLRALKGTLKRRLKKEIVIAQVVEPSLIGGFNVRIGNSVYNLSLASKAKLIKKGLREYEHQARRN